MEGKLIRGENEEYIHLPLMSKRFYAACAAIQGLLANEGLMVALSNEYPKGSDYPKIRRDYATMAYEYADELLKQENK